MDAIMWSPEKRSDGKVEIGVNYFNDDLSRMIFGSVSPIRYIELWDKKLIKHLYENKPKPDHLPTREQVVEFSRREGVSLPPAPQSKLALKPVIWPRRETLRCIPALSPTHAVPVQKISPEPAKLVQLAKPALPKVTPASVLKPVTRAEVSALPNFDLDASAMKVVSLTKREMEIAEAVIKNEKPAGLTADSLKAKTSSICTKLGIPTTHRSWSFNRLGALKRVWVRYKELVADGKVVAQSPLRVRRLEMIRATARVLWEESGRRRMFKLSKVLGRAVADNPGGPTLGTLRHFYYTELDESERASIFQLHKGASA